MRSPFSDDLSGDRPTVLALASGGKPMTRSLNEFRLAVSRLSRYGSLVRLRAVVFVLVGVISYCLRASS